MKKAILLILVLLVLMSCRSVKNHNEQITKLHDVVSLHEDIDKVYNQLKKHHPKLYQYTPKEVLDFKFDSLKNTITIPIDSREFYKNLAPVVAQVKQGHVSLSSANKWFTKKKRKQLLKSKFEFYALDFEYLQNKLWVKNTRGKDSTIVGSEVVKIEDDLISDLMDVYKTRLASDGYNTTLHNRYIGRQFSNFYYKDKGFVDSLRVTLKNEDSLFVKTFRRLQKKEKPKKQDSIKTVKRIKLTSAEKKTNRLASKKKRKFNRKHGFIKKYKKYTRNFHFMKADKDVAYMKLRSFTNGHYKKFYKESFAKLDSANTKYLILDLRDNGGGRIAEIDYLYSYLTNKDYQFIIESEVKSRVPFIKSFMSNTTPTSLKVAGALFSPFVMTHNLIKTKKRNGKLYYKFSKHSKIKGPKALRFKGNMYVLINGNSFSASSLISTHLKATKRATFVGEETGGAYNGTVAGIYKIYELPTTKLKIRMGLMQIEAPQKQQPDGYGIKPDIEIKPTIKDRKLNRDTELEWVLSDIEKKRKL